MPLGKAFQKLDEDTAMIRAYLLGMSCREPIIAVNNSANCTAEIKLFHGQEVGNFGKVINDNEDCIAASLRPWKPGDKVHLNVIPCLLRYLKWLE